jgi:hypothetical protein
VPRGRALGLTLQLPIDDRYNYSRSYLLARVAVALAGRVAEEMVFDEITTGAESDLDVVTKIVRRMVVRWGMDAPLGRRPAPPTPRPERDLDVEPAGVGRGLSSHASQAAADAHLADLS